MMDVPQIVEIKEVIEETPTIKTFSFDWDMDKYGIPNPGEFVMVWNFENEKPMSISKIDSDNSQLAITVKDVGEFTHEIHRLNAGDHLGIRGSYGKGFTTNLKDKNILAIGGGVGMAPIFSVSQNLVSNNNVDVISAAVNSDELLFVDQLDEIGANTFICTDDGSAGFKGFATDYSKELFSKNSYDMVYVCGPEIMMKGLYDIIKQENVEAEYSLERYMKCAIGICGQCCVDPTGWRICVEGPVFNNELLSMIDEFGMYKRDASGIRL